MIEFVRGAIYVLGVSKELPLDIVEQEDEMF